MRLFNKYPWSNFHKLNADWLLETVEDVANRAVAALEDITSALANAVRVTAQSFTNAEKAQARQNIGAISAEDVSDVVRVSTQNFSTAQRRIACGNIHAVSYQTQGLSADEQAQARANIGAVSSADIPVVSDVVRYTAQVTTEAQKQTARGNIGAASSADIPDVSDVVRYTAQTLTPAQKSQARANIGAGDANDVIDLQLLATLEINVEETAPGVFQFWPSLGDILYAFAHHAAVLVNLHPYNSSSVYRGLAQLAGPDNTGPVYADLLEPNAPDSLINGVGYRVFLENSGGSDVLTVSSYNFRLVPAASAADAGKTLGIDALGRSAWIDRRPLVVTWTGKNPYTTNATPQEIKEAVEAGRTVLFNETEDSAAYLNITVCGTTYMQFGTGVATYVTWDDGFGWALNIV